MLLYNNQMMLLECHKHLKVPGVITHWANITFRIGRIAAVDALERLKVGVCQAVQAHVGDSFEHFIACVTGVDT